MYNRSNAPPPDEIAEVREFLTAVLDLIESVLPEKKRALIRRAGIDGERPCDIAADLGVRPETLRSSLRNIRQWLRVELLAKGFPLEMIVSHTSSIRHAGRA